MSQHRVIRNPWGDFFPRQDYAIEPVPVENPGLPSHYREHPGVMPDSSPEYVMVVPRPGHDPQGREEHAMLARQGLVPIRSVGTRGRAFIDQPASLAEIQYAFAKNLVAYATAESPDLAGPTVAGVTANPLAQPATGGPPVVGGCIAVAELRFGHDGMNQTVFFDLPPGAILKVPFAGSSAKLLARLIPKFFSHDDGNFVARKRTYLVAPGAGAPMTNQQYNLLVNGLLAMNGFTNPNPAGFQGFFAEGSVANGDQFSKPTRRFYGSVKGAAAAPFQNTLVPVAWNAVAMMVTGGLGPLIDPATGALSASVALQFNQNGPVGSVQAGPYPLNTIVPVIDNCQSVEVFQTAGGGAGSEIPFEVVYYLSF